MKKCIICGELKSLSEFYAHKGMSDGHLNKCKQCNKAYSKKLYHEKAKDKSWIENERKRGREKARKYKSKPNLELKKVWVKTYKDKFPEKYKAKNASQRLPRKDGFNLHHWSYNEEHFIDVIEIEAKLHQKAHRFMIYDQERMMYRTLVDWNDKPKGYLLDNKNTHQLYIDFVLNNFDD